MGASFRNLGEILAFEKLLGERRRAVHARSRIGQTARDFADADGRISPEAMAAGLGGAFMLR
jgi:hypothetical protein